MKELLYTILELEGWNKKTCDFCSNLFGDDNEAVCQIRTRNPLTDELVSNDVVCENCKEKFENDELPKCGNCGRLLDKTYRDILSKKYVCDCEGNCEGKEQEKEFLHLPQQRESMTTFYERQINSLQEQLATTEEALEIEREEVAKFQEKSKEWSEKQKRELLDRIKELEAENEKLKELTPQELLDEISNLKERVKELEEQNNQLVAKIEVKEVKKQHSWLRFRK